MTPLSSQDLKALKALAEKATPGPWHWVNPDNDEPRADGDWRSSLRTVEMFGEDETIERDGQHYTSFSLPKFILEVDEIGDENMDANAAFIAAFNPQTALALIAHITALEAEIEQLNVKPSTQQWHVFAILDARAEARRLALDDVQQHLRVEGERLSDVGVSYFVETVCGSILALKERT